MLHVLSLATATTPFFWYREWQLLSDQLSVSWRDHFPSSSLSVSCFFLCPSSSFFPSIALNSNLFLLNSLFLTERLFPITNHQIIPVGFACLYNLQMFSPIPWEVPHKWKKMGSLLFFRTRKSQLPSTMQTETRVALNNTRWRKSVVVSRQSTRIKTDRSTNTSYLQLAISLSGSNLSKSGRIGSQTQYLWK